VFSVFSYLQAYVEELYVEIVHYCFFSYPLHFIHHSNSAIQCNITDATEMT
jgi:hypothetical protein